VPEHDRLLDAASQRHVTEREAAFRAAGLHLDRGRDRPREQLHLCDLPATYVHGEGGAPWPGAPVSRERGGHAAGIAGRNVERAPLDREEFGVRTCDGTERDAHRLVALVCARERALGHRPDEDGAEVDRVDAPDAWFRVVGWAAADPAGTTRLQRGGGGARTE